MSETGRRLMFRSDRTVEIESFPVPEPGPGQVLVRVEQSQVSAGSEMNFFRHNPIDGPLVKAQLGYMTVGRVQAVGDGVTDYQPGDRVLTSGYHQSHWIVDLHGDAVARPGIDYIQKIDNDVPAAEAGFMILGDVALHGVRRGTPQIDESVVVFGAGLVGQLTIQLARIAGTRVLVLGDMGEVGDNGPAMHVEVGNYAREQGLDALITLGEASRAASAAFGAGARACASVDEVVAALRGLRPSCVLVKGSRFMRMERVVTAFSTNENTAAKGQGEHDAA